MQHFIQELIIIIIITDFIKKIISHVNLSEKMNGLKEIFLLVFLMIHHQILLIGNVQDLITIDGQQMVQMQLTALITTINIVVTLENYFQILVFSHLITVEYFEFIIVIITKLFIESLIQFNQHLIYRFQNQQNCFLASEVVYFMLFLAKLQSYH